MKTRPTDQEIEAEIQALKAIKPKVQRFTAFGDDNHAAIDAQIETLEKRFTNDQVYDRYEPRGDRDLDLDEGRTEEILMAALDAMMWRLGESSNGAPSKNWQE